MLKDEKYATISLILGITSLTTWLIPFIGYINSVVGLVFSSISLTSDAKGRSVSGLILNTIGLLLTIAMTIICIIFIKK